MKRGLKVQRLAARQAPGIVEEDSPMKRGLKGTGQGHYDSLRAYVEEDSPMKRGLKGKVN